MNNVDDIKNIKNIKGLIKPKKYVVKSLSDYIKHLSKIDSQKYFFRGESNYYYEIIASGLRDNDNISYNSKLPFYNMIREYYKEVGQRISNLDRKSFTAFSQHHGVPTNLIDITTSPLISLYFACQENLDSGDKTNNLDGFVYAISKDKTIDITDTIDKFGDIHVNIIELLSSRKSEIIKNNYQIFRGFFENNIELLKYYINLLLDDYSYYKINGILEEKKNKEIKFLKRAVEGCYTAKPKYFSFNHEPNKEIESKVLNEKHNIQNKYNDKLQILIKNIEDELDIRCSDELYEYNDKIIYVYYLLVKKFLINIKELGEYIAWLNFIPIFTYNPITEFQRIKNQQGLFIHQGYQISHETVYDFFVFTKQRIWVDKVFIIKNKRDILKELDNIGINRKFVFHDFDNIARYIINHK